VAFWVMTPRGEVTMKIEDIIVSSKMLVTTCKITHHNPEDHKPKFTASKSQILLGLADSILALSKSEIAQLQSILKNR
jgi:hypothetical protein